MTTPLRLYFARHPDDTHAALARRTGIPLDTIRAYVHGRRKPGRAASVAIERETAGEVTPASWDEGAAAAAGGQP
jgi:hypothetical protein